MWALVFHGHWHLKQSLNQYHLIGFLEVIAICSLTQCLI
jgi:hypothetical protein